MGGAILEPLVERAGAALEKRGLNEAYDYWVKSAAKTLEDNIPGYGKVLREGLRGFKEAYGQAKGQLDAEWEQYAKPVEKIPEAKQDLHQYFTGAAQHPDPSVDSLNKFIASKRLGLYARAAKDGIPVGPPTPDGWARKWKPGSFDGKNLNDAIENLRKQGKSVSEAKRIVELMSERSKGRKSFNLRVGREADMPGWRKDMYSQLEAMHGELYDVLFHEHFGENGKKLDSLLNEIYDKHGNASHQFAERYTDVVLRKTGGYYKAYNSIEKSVNSLLAARYLGSISIRHAGQSLNALLFGGRMKPMVNTILDIANDFGDARLFSLQSGSVNLDSLSEVRKEMEEGITHEQKLGSKVFELTGFPKLMRINRILTSNYGKHLARELVDEYSDNKSPYIARKLAQLGIDAESAVREGLSNEDLYRAASRTTEVTMSPMEPENLPIAWRHSPGARMLTQYKPFIYMQTRLLKDHVLKPAIEFFATGGKSGDIRPLAYLALTFPTVGELISDAYNLSTKGTLSQRPSTKYWLDRYVDNIAALGGLGMLNDLIFALTSDQAASTPLTGELQNLLAIARSKHKGKELARQIPIVGRAISHQMRPKTGPPKGMEGYLYKGHLTKSLDKLLGGSPGGALDKLFR